MIAQAHIRFLRIGPRKARLVADDVRGKSVKEALEILPTINKKISEYLYDVISSAMANARNTHREDNLTDDMLYISKITVDGGPTLSRFRAASMGRASQIRKRTSHISVQLDRRADNSAVKTKKTRKTKKTKAAALKG